MPGLVPEGLTLFCGRPKIGKSWAGLDIPVRLPQAASVLAGKQRLATSSTLLSKTTIDAYNVASTSCYPRSRPIHTCRLSRLHGGASTRVGA